MNQPSANQKQHLLKKRDGIWVVLIILAFIFFMNHYFQWYPWPSQEKYSQAKEQITKQVVQSDTLSHANEQFQIKNQSRHTLEYLANEHKSESLDTDPPKQKLIMDYERIKDYSDPDINNIIEKRKKELGLDKSVDMVLTSGEFIRIGEQVIPLDQILGEIEAYHEVQPVSVDTLKLKTQPLNTREDKIESSVKQIQSTQNTVDHDHKTQNVSEIESHLTTIIRNTKPKTQSTSYYGIYVTRRGDNLWNIHFTFLREYFSSRGIKISIEADEPLGDQSSGVGRILKYAEKMVYVFNLKTKKLSKDISLLKPMERIVVFNISKLDNVLSTMSAEQLNSIHFDGQDLIIHRYS